MAKKGDGTNFCEVERFCRSAGRTDGPQSAPYIYRWLKKGMERISDGQNGSAVLPAELFFRSAGRTVLSFCRQNGTVVLPAERYCRSAGRTDGPQSAPYIYRWLKKGMERISDGQNG